MRIFRIAVAAAFICDSPSKPWSAKEGWSLIAQKPAIRLRLG